MPAVCWVAVVVSVVFASWMAPVPAVVTVVLTVPCTVVPTVVPSPGGMMLFVGVTVVVGGTVAPFTVVVFEFWVETGTFVPSI